MVDRAPRLAGGSLNVKRSRSPVSLNGQRHRQDSIAHSYERADGSRGSQSPPARNQKRPLPRGRSSELIEPENSPALAVEPQRANAKVCQPRQQARSRAVGSSPERSSGNEGLGSRKRSSAGCAFPREAGLGTIRAAYRAKMRAGLDATHRQDQGRAFSPRSQAQAVHRRPGRRREPGARPRLRAVQGCCGRSRAT